MGIVCTDFFAGRAVTPSISGREDQAWWKRGAVRKGSAFDPRPVADSARNHMSGEDRLDQFAVSIALRSSITPNFLIIVSTSPTECVARAFSRMLKTSASDVLAWFRPSRAPDGTPRAYHSPRHLCRTNFSEASPCVGLSLLVPDHRRPLDSGGPALVFFRSPPQIRKLSLTQAMLGLRKNDGSQLRICRISERRFRDALLGTSARLPPSRHPETTSRPRQPGRGA